MPYTPTGRPVGRPKTKEYKTISLKIPQDLLDRVQRYGRMHRQTISELIRDGLEWRITEGDPRGQSLYGNKYSGNTELDELAQPAHLVDEGMPFDEDIAATPDQRLQDSNTVLPKEVHTQPATTPAHTQNGNTVLPVEVPQRKPGRPSTLRQPILELLRAHPDGLTAVQIKVHLDVRKNIGDTLAGMVRNHLLTKQGNGAQVRYLAVTAQPQDAPKRQKTKRQARV